MVVRLSEGREAIQAYIKSHASRGLDHVYELVEGDNTRVLTLIGDLTEAEAMAVTPADEWRIFDAMKHMAASLDRSKDRLQKLSSGQAFVPPSVAVRPGGLGSDDYASFSALRCRYIDGMADILAVLRGADEDKHLELTADHAKYGPFNWLGWALYSHHVHTHDHIGQVEAIRKELRAR